jgi:hypothetical protein
LGRYFLNTIEVDLADLRDEAGIHAIHYGLPCKFAKVFPFSIYYRIENELAIVYAILSCRVLVHRQVEFAISRLTHGEFILHGDFAASCGEGLSHFPKVGMEGSGPSKEFAPHSTSVLHDASAAADTSAEPYPS